jgi:hypothetical protein
LGVRSTQVDLRYQYGFVTYDGKDVVGLIFVFVNQGKAEIGWMRIRPDLYRHGVGRSLLRLIEYRQAA